MDLMVLRQRGGAFVGLQHGGVTFGCHAGRGGGVRAVRSLHRQQLGVRTKEHGRARLVMSNGPPINLPSGVLLMFSSVLAIASVGSVFELSSGHPQYGTPVTAAILAASFPGFLFMFWATLQKGKAEESE
ncbi:hypothetical protein FVE85_9503 [Porphyridium purpureum]|uniref:Uncharacterized protein n=1 Tax=Porphyridium purpureum TaxID=35688 RepID=A0A5J4YIY8_PORPP|nr:hypothetical protein FVE85_9503 [Porphyridium purpureum]|eukprot:POR0694..scf261_15